MKKFYFGSFIILIAAIGISYATLVAAQAADHYPPQQINCQARTGKFTCTIPPEDLPYLTINSYIANAPSGIYTFQQGESFNSKTPHSVIIYTYQIANSQYKVRLRTTYIGIDADISNPNWQLVGPPELGYYQCITTAISCPFTNTPYLKAT